MLLLHVLEEPCFIDGREEDWAGVRGTYVQGSRWVLGHFEFPRRPFPPYVNEVASVYAEVDLARRLPGADDWLPEPLVRDYRDGFQNKLHLLPVGQRWVDGLHGSGELRQ
jgi:hypothetical protein